MKSTNQRLSSSATPPRGATAPDDGGVLTRDDLAKRLRVSTRTVSEWQQDRTIPYIKVGKVVLFYWPDVIAHLRENYRVCLRTATAADAAKGGGMNSREKGKRGERQWRDELRAKGYDARRGQQFSGSPESPDVICEALAWAHFEVKAVERLNIEDAMEQARRDAGQAGPAPTALRAGKVPFVAHKRNFRPWLITMTAETFFQFLRGVLPPDSAVAHVAPGVSQTTNQKETTNEDPSQQFQV